MKTMKEYETLKIYGKVLNEWTSTNEKGRTITTQVEIAYKEYDSNGRLVGIGSEDFSMARYRAELNDYRIWGWDGKTFNKGGHRWFDELAWARINRKDVHKLKKIAEALHGKGQEILQIRAVW